MNETNLPELDLCSRCHDHTSWEWDAAEGWLSACCGARPIAVDVEPPDDLPPEAWGGGFAANH